MTELLRDSIWQFVGALLGFVTIIITIILYFLQRNRKSLVYQVLAETSLLTLNEEIKGKIQILYEGTSIQNVHLLILRLLNKGTTPIEASDFEKPLIFHFGNEAQLLSSEIINTEPANLNPIFIIGKNEIEFHPFLINSKDSITLKFLLAQYDGTIHVDGRIKGVKEVKKSPLNPNSYEVALAISFSLATILSLINVLFFNSQSLACVILIIVLFMIFTVIVKLFRTPDRFESDTR